MGDEKKVNDIVEKHMNAKVSIFLFHHYIFFVYLCVMSAHVLLVCAQACVSSVHI